MVNVNHNFSIPIQQRGKKAHTTTTILAILFIFFGSYFSKGTSIFYTFVLNITTWVMLVMIVEILYRLCLLVEEYYHIPSRYDGMKDILMKTFTFSPEFCTVFAILFIILYYVCLQFGNPVKISYEFGPSSFCSLIGALLLNTLLRPKYGTLYQSLSIGNINGLDFGSSMAFSFFHGYLRIVLPENGTEQKGIKELMQDFEARQQITFEYDRLLVLIPMSLYCPPNMEQNSKIAELAQSLQEIRVNRAGVSKRSYKSTAYKIRQGNRKVYVCVEYATPLHTLHEIIKNNNEYSANYKAQRKELTLQFYLTLQDILKNDPDCKDCCDLIFFDDKTENGEFVDVGQVVLDHLDKVKKNKKNV